MTAEIFQGVTPLHIAVVTQNISLVRHLIDRGADVATLRVTGLFFRKSLRGLIYYGEHILSFAACVGNKDIISMLIDAGASTRVQDEHGNTVLHILVLQPNRTIACQALDLIMARDAELDQPVPIDMMPNNRGLTTFKLAAKKGNTVVFQHLVNKRRVVQWNMGPLTSMLYDLTEIDSWADNMSVLELIVVSPHREPRRILELTPVRQLVSLKWNLYGKHYFRVLLFVYLLYIWIFTMCCVFRPIMDIPGNNTNPHDKTVMMQKPLNESYATHADHLRLVGEIISVLGAVVILLLEIPDMLKVGAKHYFGQTALGGPFHAIFISYAFLVVILCVFRVCSVQAEKEVMAMCLVLCWTNVLYFARGFEMFGPYVIMIQKVLFGDLLKFMFLMVIVDIGFGSALWMVYMTQAFATLNEYSYYFSTLWAEWEINLTLVNMPENPTYVTPLIVYVVQVAYTLFAYMCLLYLMKAMLVPAVMKVAEERDELWRTQVVATTLMLERRLPRRLWPRLGMCGLDYGLSDSWYLRVQTDQNQDQDQTLQDQDQIQAMQIQQLQFIRAELQKRRTLIQKLIQNRTLTDSGSQIFI
ncbi:transient receptor potential cation channel subfamily V member 5 [Perca flavescens]|uniref:transient receptor potential cation channel subfamily V member 5 n=1 Tax=Perca flavescens TaxID=8167 RepID=UPI00106DFCB1|nr:transient receptor potential cation channel subfamily V member 5-like [Perca flavescens]